MDDNPEIRDSLNVNKSTYHNQRSRERFICFIRGAKWMKINQLNGPSSIHDTSTWLSQSIQSITHVCWACKKIFLKVLQESFRPLRFPVNKCFPERLTHAQTLPLAVTRFKIEKSSTIVVDFAVNNSMHWLKMNFYLLQTSWCSNRSMKYERNRCVNSLFTFCHGFWIIL